VKRWVRAVAFEVLGLFVDDAVFAASVCAWLLFSGLVQPRLGLQPWIDGLALFAGLVAILIESSVRRART
jgi:hypothetical protein